MNKLNNVSFGAIYTRREAGHKKVTEHQQYVENAVDREFLKRINKNGTDVNTKTPRDLDSLLEEEMYQDVKILHKKNGDVYIKLTSVDKNGNNDEGVDAINPKDQIGVLISSKLSPKEINKKIKAFADNCREKAKYYEKELSNILGKKFNDKINSMNSSMTEREIKIAAELKRLREEEDFIREFGTDRYN